MRRAGTWWMILGGAMALAACGGNVDVKPSDGAGGSGSTSTGAGAGGTTTSTTTTGSGTGGGPNACTSPEAKACGSTAECVLSAASCCICGAAELSDYVAVNQAHASDCACDGPACGCASAPNPNLAVSCEAGQCKGWDVRARDALSACTTDADCRLRVGLSCCEGCSAQSFDLVAIRTDAEGALESLMCSPGEACALCAPQYPPNTVAQCISGHCAVVTGL